MFTLKGLLWWMTGATTGSHFAGEAGGAFVTVKHNIFDTYREKTLKKQIFGFDFFVFSFILIKKENFKNVTFLILNKSHNLLFKIIKLKKEHQIKFLSRFRKIKKK